MTKSLGKEVVVGAVFFGIMALLGTFTIIVRGVSPFNPPEKAIVYFREGVGGLRTGNVVRISGFEVGEVEEMSLQPVGVLALIRVRSGVRIHPGYEIKVRSFSVLGGKYVDVERGRQTDPPLTLVADKAEAAFARIRAEAGAGGGLDGRGGFHMEGASDLPLKGTVEADLLPAISDLAEDIGPEIKRTVTNIADVSEKINSMQGTLGKLVGDPALFDSLNRAASSIELATADLATIADRLERGEGTLGKLLRDERLYDAAAKAAENVESVTAKIDRGEGTIGMLVSSEKTAKNVDAAIEKLASVLAKADDGTGTVGQLINNAKLYEELEKAAESIAVAAANLEEAKGPLGVLLNDEKAGRELQNLIAQLERSSANIQTITTQIADGKGTIGRLVMDDRLIQEAEKVIVEVRESVEDLREQAPINAFIQAAFQAF